MADYLHSPGIATPLLPYSRPTTPGILPQLGFVGIGAMGLLMARNLAIKRKNKHGPPLLVWNRTPERSQKLLQEAGQEHIRVAQTLAQLATECDIIFTWLANDTAVKSAFQEMTAVIKVRALSYVLPSTNAIT